jgi:hypothetical protein
VIKPNKQKTIGIVEVPSFRCPPAKHAFLLPALLSTEERSQYAENQLEQDPSSGRELTPSVLWSMLNRIFGTHSHRSLAALPYFGISNGRTL